MIGQILVDRYRIIEERASNVFGTTYLAEDTYRPGYPHCLVKQLRPFSDSPKTPQMVKLLLKKRVSIRQRLGESDYVPAILASFEENQQLYLVEELVPGHAFSEELAAGRAMSQDEVLPLLERMLEILVFIHGHGVVHQDIQPSHLIRRSPDGKLVLINFKLIREVTTPGSDLPRRSLSSAAIEAQIYKPPEQLQGKAAPASDIFAVGVITIQALMGLRTEAIANIQPPYQFATELAAWRRQSHTHRELADILEKMICPSFEQRYQTATDVLFDLRQIIPTINVSTFPTKFAPVQAHPQPATTAIPVHHVASENEPLLETIPAKHQLVVANQNSSQSVIPHPPVAAAAVVVGPGDPSQQPTQLRRKSYFLPAGIVVLLGAGLVLAWQRQVPSTLLAQPSLQQGLQMSQKQDFRAAIANFTQAIQTHSHNRDAFYNRGLAYYKLGKKQEALMDLTKAIELQPRDAQAHFYRGDIRYTLGDNNGALSDYNTAIQLDPSFAPAYLSRGNAKAELGDEPGAMVDYNQAIEHNPKLAEAYLNRCLTRSNLNDQPGAIADCTEAINLDPTYAFAYQNRGLARRRQADIQGAIADFNIAIRLIPKDADPYYNRGLARYELGDRQGAIADFNTAVRLNAAHTLVYYDRGLVRAEVGDVKGAIADFQEAAKLCLDQGRTACYKDAQYQLKRLQ